MRATQRSPLRSLRYLAALDLSFNQFSVLPFEELIPLLAQPMARPLHTQPLNTEPRSASVSLSVKVRSCSEMPEPTILVTSHALQLAAVPPDRIHAQSPEPPLQRPFDVSFSGGEINFPTPESSYNKLNLTWQAEIDTLGDGGGGQGLHSQASGQSLDWQQDVLAPRALAKWCEQTCR